MLSLEVIADKKERPILFSGEMVRAILEGRKTQTRRPLTRLKGYRSITEFQASDTAGYDYTFRRPDLCWCDYRIDELLGLCPFGQSGDQLWVRETFTEAQKGGYLFKADGTNKQLGVWWGWKPSIHMPRRASRIKLEITGVRVERIRDISCEDAIAEGMNPQDSEFPVRMMFEDLWHESYPDSWTLNDWVWVIEFRKIS